MPKESVKKDSLARLRKIEGQVKGIQRMIENDRYCIDIINQITAAGKALDQVSLVVMKGHLETCVSDAIQKGQSNEKIEELINSLYKFIK